MKRIISIILIAAGLGLGFFGLNKMTNSTASLEVGPMELSATDEDQKTEGMIFLGLGAVLLVGGIYSFSKK